MTTQLKNEWKVSRNTFFYQVMRIKDRTKPMHGGNVEYYGGAYSSRDEAEKALKEVIALETRR